MRKFITKICIIAAFLLGIVMLLLGLSRHETFGVYVTELTGSREYAEGYNMGAIEILPYLDKVRTPDASTSLILGDSVCFRMFSELQDKNPNYCIAGTNRGITMSGQYILLHEYLKNHPEATDVYLILIEDSLLTTYETGYGYQYAVMPFLMSKTIDLLEEETLDEMRHTYGSFMISRKAAYFINESAFGKKLYLNLLNKLAPVSSTYDIPDVSETYIVKMAELCADKNVTLHLLASPLADTDERREIEGLIRSNYENSLIYEYFPDYFEKLIYYPAEDFSDGVHPSVDRASMNEMIRTMQKNFDCMYDLTLE